MAKGTDVHTGSSLDEFLDEEGYRDEVESAAIKRSAPSRAEVEESEAQPLECWRIKDGA